MEPWSGFFMFCFILNHTFRGMVMMLTYVDPCPAWCTWCLLLIAPAWMGILRLLTSDLGCLIYWSWLPEDEADRIWVKPSNKASNQLLNHTPTLKSSFRGWIQLASMEKSEWVDMNWQQTLIVLLGYFQRLFTTWRSWLAIPWVFERQTSEA